MTSNTTSVAVPTPSYLPDLIALEAGLCSVVQLTSSALMLHLIANSRLWRQLVPSSSSSSSAIPSSAAQQLSPTMLLYLVAHSVLGLASLPFYLYTLVGWRPASMRSHPPVLYDPLTLFWLGELSSSYYGLMPLPVIFLTLDRCLVIALAQRADFYIQLQRRLAIGGLALILGVYTLLATSGVALDLPALDANAPELRSCLTNTCLMAQTRGIYVLCTRNTLEGLALVSTAVFFYLLRVRHGGQTTNVVSGGECPTQYQVSVS